MQLISFYLCTELYSSVIDRMIRYFAIVQILFVFRVTTHLDA